MHILTASLKLKHRQVIQTVKSPIDVALYIGNFVMLLNQSDLSTGSNCCIMYNT